MNRRAAMLFVLFGCAAKQEMSSGPTLETSVATDSDTVYDKVGTFHLDTGKTDYEVTIDVQTSDGRADRQSFPVQTLTATLAVDGSPLPVPIFSTDGSSSDPKFTSKPFVIPGSSKGKTFTVHLEGVDGRGLRTNVVDMTIALM
jgi:hypothetical protein